MQKAVIIGLGLMGGSFGYALRKKVPGVQVMGIDLDQEIIEAAKSLGAVDSGSVELEPEMFRGAGLVVIATPIGLIVPLLIQIIPYLDDNTIITDVGSTKNEIVQQAESAIYESGRRLHFVGGHPMTGSEMNGIMALEPTLYENIVYILTKSPDTDEQAFSTLKEITLQIGSIVTELDPARHDEIVAFVSHLPMIVASSLVKTLGEKSRNMTEITSFVAGGFRDITRIASSDPIIWKDIFLSNRLRLKDSVQLFTDVLSDAQKHIESEDAEFISGFLGDARDLRNSIPQKKRGILAQRWEIVISVPDRPGMIGDVAYQLGKNKINIRDIEVLKVREGEAGSIRIALTDHPSVLAALSILKEAGYTAMERK